MTTDGFGPWLQAELRKRHWSQTEFARRGGFYRSSVSKWVLGRRVPGAASLRQIANTLGVPVDEVLAAAGLQPQPQPTSLEHERAIAAIHCLPPERVRVVLPLLHALISVGVVEEGRMAGDGEREDALGTV